jgi:hypothetical protein
MDYLLKRNYYFLLIFALFAVVSSAASLLSSKSMTRLSCLQITRLNGLYSDIIYRVAFELLLLAFGAYIN